MVCVKFFLPVLNRVIIKTLHSIKNTKIRENYHFSDWISKFSKNNENVLIKGSEK